METALVTAKINGTILVKAMTIDGSKKSGLTNVVITNQPTIGIKNTKRIFTKRGW